MLGAEWKMTGVFGLASQYPFDNCGKHRYAVCTAHSFLAPGVNGVEKPRY